VDLHPRELLDGPPGGGQLHAAAEAARPGRVGRPLGVETELGAVAVAVNDKLDRLALAVKLLAAKVNQVADELFVLGSHLREGGRARRRVA